MLCAGDDGEAGGMSALPQEFLDRKGAAKDGGGVDADASTSYGPDEKTRKQHEMCAATSTVLCMLDTPESDQQLTQGVDRSEENPAHCRCDWPSLHIACTNPAKAHGLDVRAWTGQLAVRCCFCSSTNVQTRRTACRGIVGQLDSLQSERYELYRRSKLKPASMKKVRHCRSRDTAANSSGAICMTSLAPCLLVIHAQHFLNTFSKAACMRYEYALRVSIRCSLATGFERY